MSEDQNKEQVKETSAPVEAKEETKQEKKTESKMFTQEQLDNILQARIMSERKKYERKMEDEEKQKTELLKQKQLDEAKSKAEIENDYYKARRQFALYNILILLNDKRRRV